jgi:hypothetical protein
MHYIRKYLSPSLPCRCTARSSFSFIIFHSVLSSSTSNEIRKSFRKKEKKMKVETGQVMSETLLAFQLPGRSPPSNTYGDSAHEPILQFCQDSIQLLTEKHVFYSQTNSNKHTHVDQYLIPG